MLLSPVILVSLNSRCFIKPEIYLNDIYTKTLQFLCLYYTQTAKFDVRA